MWISQSSLHYCLFMLAKYLCDGYGGQFVQDITVDHDRITCISIAAVYIPIPGFAY